VVDDGGNLLALERLEGTFSAGSKIATGKARTAVRFKQPTKVFEDLIKQGPHDHGGTRRTSHRCKEGFRSSSVEKLLEALA
jgi:uncharacterized protein GlcG (DUF336 family)